MIIQVAVSLLALLALSAFVFDYGVMWAARRQAQNAADAGALAGALSRAFDYTTDANVRRTASAVARRNGVWGAAPSVTTDDVFIEACRQSPGLPPDPGCVRVEVARTAARSNAVNTYFGRLAGILGQDIRATATARGVAANAANCLRPWAVADRWNEVSSPPWTQQSVFEPGRGDTYDPAYGFSQTDANGTPRDHGMQLILKDSNSGSPTAPGTMSAGWSMAVDLPNASTPTYDSNINGCTSATVAIAPPGEPCATADPSRGCLDILTGGHNITNNPNSGFAQLIGTDPNARWSNNAVTGSAYAMSPRIVPIAVFDPALYLSRGYNGTQGVLRVVNLVGFFIEGTCGGRHAVRPEPAACPRNGPGADIIGRLVRFPGTYVASGGTVTGAFGTLITLVR